MRIEGENTSKAPTIPNLNEMVKMRGKNYYYVTIHIIQVRYWFFNPFFKHVFTFLINLMEQLNR